ncbi:MAG: ComEA family DNA-binding protein [Leptothrix sp. (in: b-proteobacteria)]
MVKILLGLLMALFAALSQAAVDVNKGSQAELESVRGIGPAMSARLLDERKKSAFKDWTDLIDRIKGIGPGNASKFSEAGLTVNGSLYEGGARTKQVSKKLPTASPATVAKDDKK